MDTVPARSDARKPLGPRDLFRDEAEDLGDAFARAVQAGEDLRPLLERAVRLAAPRPRPR